GSCGRHGKRHQYYGKTTLIPVVFARRLKKFWHTYLPHKVTHYITSSYINGYCSRYPVTDRQPCPDKMSDFFTSLRCCTKLLGFGPETENGKTCPALLSPKAGE